MSACPRARVDARHGRYRIIAGLVGETARAVAWLERSSILVGSGGSVDEAVDNARAALDRRIADERARRRRPEVPTALEFEEALRTIALDADDRAMLRAHARSARGEAALAEIAAAAGIRSDAWAAAQYGALGQTLAAGLGLQPPGLNGDPSDWIAVLAEPARARRDAQRWRMHAELREALAELGLA